MKWSYGVTTHRSRINGLLQSTLASLDRAGFASPVLFADDISNVSVFKTWMNLECEARYPRIGAFANFWLGLVSLYVRDPHADVYAMFQDDIVCSLGVRQYIESTIPDCPCYLNLCTYPANILPCDGIGWYPAVSSFGLGAQALVFPSHSLRVLLQSKWLVEHPRDRFRGTQAIDGIVKSSFRDAGVIEFVHNPTLVNHVGNVSAIGHPPQPPSYGFLGEDYDLMTILNPKIGQSKELVDE